MQQTTTSVSESTVEKVAPAALRIRRARQNDIPALESLIELAVLELENGLLAVDPQLIADGSYFVAEMEDRIVGGGGWSRRRKVVNDGKDPSDDDLLDPATEGPRSGPSSSTPNVPAWASAAVSCAPARERRNGRASGDWS